MPMDLIKKSVSSLPLPHNNVGKQERPIRSLVLLPPYLSRVNLSVWENSFLLAFKISRILKGKEESCHSFFFFFFAINYCDKQ